MKFKKAFSALKDELRRRDYRYYICAAISLVFLGCGFLFPNALPRLGESIRDLMTSFIYYVAEVFNIEQSFVVPTVVAMPEWNWAPSPWEPLKLFPWTWEEFKILWSKYWARFFTKENLLGYLSALEDVLYYASRYLVILIPLLLVFKLLFKRYTRQRKKPKLERKTVQLITCEKLYINVVFPIVAWIKDFVLFLKKEENKRFLFLWLSLWVLYFNLAAIAIEFFAFYLYFAVTFEFAELYVQLQKLLLDLAPMVRFLPGAAWFCVGTFVYNYVCRSMAFARLYQLERGNRAFLKKRGIVTTVYGEMGTGKTQLITSMALSAEVEQWDNAFKIMLNKDLMFPNFPWQKLRDYLTRAVDQRELVDLDAVRARIKTFRRGFDYIIKRGFTPATWREELKTKKHKLDYTFGYDFEHYAYTYNDNLKVSHLYDAVEEYACAYLIYTVRTSLIFANYSIRVDSLIRDLGNMPIRDNDFFRRDSRLMDSYSRHCHIINYDMLRLGKRMQKVFKLSFGVYVITEIDKERKNTLELRETKKSEETCNQVNDLFNACLMMCRHAAVVDNIPFIRIICDLQRPEAWGAGGRELGEVIYISEKCEEYPTLPFFSPYWVLEWIFSWIRGERDDFHTDYTHVRRDGTLFAYLIDNVISKIQKHYDKVDGSFGVFSLNLQLQSGRLDGNVSTDKWTIIKKKDRSNRYKTDCLSSVFATYEPNTMHIDDFICYAGSVGTLKENGLQLSYFQGDIDRMKKAA